MNRKLLWAEIWLLSIMAEYFKLQILYTPLIPHLESFETNNNKSYLQYLLPIENDYSQNHIYYLREEKVDEKLIYDERGATIFTDYFTSKSRKVSEILPF